VTFQETERQSRSALTAAGLTFGYPNGATLLDRLNLNVLPSSLTCVTGPSGAGKSTLLYCLAGVLPAQGHIEIMGHRLSPDPAQRAAIRMAHCGFIFQRGELLPEMTVLENVALPLRLTGTGRHDAINAAQHWLDRLGIAECAPRRSDEISGGQAQRASVARALIHQPSVIFADEPTASLDPTSRARVLHALHTAIRAGAAVLCATHDPELVRDADTEYPIGNHKDIVDATT